MLPDIAVSGFIMWGMFYVSLETVPHTWTELISIKKLSFLQIKLYTSTMLHSEIEIFFILSAKYRQPLEKSLTLGDMHITKNISLSGPTEDGEDW